MVLFVLPGSRLMAIKTSHAFVGMLAQLILVNHGILGTGVAFSTFAGGPDKLGAGLLGLAFRTCTVHQKSRQHESKSYDNRNKNRSKGHDSPSNRSEEVQYLFLRPRMWRSSAIGIQTKEGGSCKQLLIVSRIHRMWCRYDTSIMAPTRHTRSVAPSSRAILKRRRSNEFSGNLEEPIEAP